VGAAERGATLPDGVVEGDLLIGLGSDGLHSNGFSMVRKIVELSGLAWDADCPFGGGTLGAALLTPTRLYATAVLAAIRAGGVHGLAHITGGGLSENLPRIFPPGLGCDVNLEAWRLPPVFGWLAATGGISETELIKTMNCGIGMVLVVAADRSAELSELLSDHGESVYQIGQVTAAAGVRYTGSLL